MKKFSMGLALFLIKAAILTFIALTVFIFCNKENPKEIIDTLPDVKDTTTIDDTTGVVHPDMSDNYPTFNIQ